MRGRENAAGDGFSAGGEAYGTQLQQPHRQGSTWKPFSPPPPQQQFRSTTAAGPRSRQAYSRAIRSLEELPSSSFRSRSNRVLNATLAPGSEFDGFRQRQQHRVALVARPSLSNVGDLAVPAQHDSGTVCIAGGLRHGKQGREVNNGRSDSISAPTASGSGAYTPDSFNDHPGQHQPQYVAAPHDRNTHRQHNRQRSTNSSTASYPSGGDSNVGVGSPANCRASISTMARVESPSMAVGENRRRLEVVSSGSESCPQLGGLEAFPHSTHKYAPVRNGAGGSGSMDSTAVTTSWPQACAPSSDTLPPLKNPTDWPQHFSLGQSMNGSGSGGNDRDAASPPPQDQGGAATATALRTCPAQDCPAGSHNCLHDATPDMLVYEVNFKRATRTFLLGGDLDHNTIVCGTLVKVGDVWFSSRIVVREKNCFK